MGLPRQKYWSGLLFPSPGDLPNPGMEFTSPVLAGGFFTTEPPEKPKREIVRYILKTSMTIYCLMCAKISVKFE